MFDCCECMIESELFLQYATIELTHKGEPYASPAPSCWLCDVTLSDEGGKLVKRGECFWPKDEGKLSDWVERRKKPDLKSGQWVFHVVTVLKLCRK